ncbi:hypothetical protein OH456_07210 [Vibrio sp. La 4.2.2]|uniref:hypothetical protein n=1 Tax=Vibrio sp. La 4.2.2 TaxID=2998830 RepID=UPI0022CDC2C6|nr:hypothetical protein [Vibrio sp. La 4.2.2]MDA0107925.1 hypothetical protein [Vibrio sp. La 4.2.2]
MGVAGLAGAVAGVAVTGDAEGAYTGQMAGSSVHQNNYLAHTDIQLALERFTSCEGEPSCEQKVVKETLALSAENDELALSDCSESRAGCAPHGLVINNATLPDNADSHYDIIGDSESALDFYQLMTKQNIDINGPLVDASTQHSL